MNKTKKLLIGLTLGAFILGAAALTAQPIEAHKGFGQGKAFTNRYAAMSDTQKAECTARHEQKMQWKIQDLAAAVAEGKLTQREADARIIIMQEHLKAMQEVREVFKKYKLDYANMNQEQKIQFATRYEQKMQWKAQDLQRAIAEGKITQEYADRRIAKMNTKLQAIKDGSYFQYKAEKQLRKAGEKKYNHEHFKKGNCN